MAVSEKQLIANRKNAKKGGVRTAEGKAIVRRNALKHGLLAKEIVITVGEGAESQEEFDALLADLVDEYKPEEITEELLVEKMAVCYWRLRRACRYEVGLLREELDNATDDYYNLKTYDGEKVNMKDQELDLEIEQVQRIIARRTEGIEELREMAKDGKALREIYDLEDGWNHIYSMVLRDEEEPEEYEEEPQYIRKYLKENGWSDQKIWDAHIDFCESEISALRDDIQRLQKGKNKNKLALQVKKKLGNIPSREDLDRLLKYEGSIERQLYKAMNQLERLQRLRAGDNVPAPVKLDVDLNAPNMS